MGREERRVQGLDYTHLVSSLLGSNNSSKMSIRVCLVVSCNLEDQQQISHLCSRNILDFPERRRSFLLATCLHEFAAKRLEVRKDADGYVLLGTRASNKKTKTVHYSKLRHNLSLMLSTMLFFCSPRALRDGSVTPVKDVHFFLNFV